MRALIAFTLVVILWAVFLIYMAVTAEIACS